MTTNGNSYKMHNLGLAESHPSVLRGDRILICISGGGFISKYEGVIYCACLDKTINLWKARLRADGFSSKVSGITLRNRALIENLEFVYTKVNKANVVIWTVDLVGHDYDESDSTIMSFLIVRYLHLHMGNPDNYKILKLSLPYVRKRSGTDNLAEGVVKVFTWDWMDVALLHYLRGESMAYAGVLIDQDSSMKWRWLLVFPRKVQTYRSLCMLA
jgi:hypothetical protein